MFKKIKDYIYDNIYLPIIFRTIYFRSLKIFTSLYGNFEKLTKNDYRKFALTYTGLNKNVTGLLRPEIVKIIRQLDFVPKRILLDGDTKSVVDQFKAAFNYAEAEVLTTGLGDDFDFIWDFENDPPIGLAGDFDLIVSQAMFEHLINPYKHLVDLTGKLKSQGLIIVHSVVPGFPYHRYPIDSVRFFPDFFEKAATNLGLRVVRKFLNDFHLVYVFKK